MVDLFFYFSTFDTTTVVKWKKCEIKMKNEKKFKILFNQNRNQKWIKYTKSIFLWNKMRKIEWIVQSVLSSMVNTFREFTF